jgi:hypothetical protein
MRKNASEFGETQLAVGEIEDQSALLSEAAEVRHIRHDILVFRFEPGAWHHSLAGLWQSLGWRPSAEAQVAQSFAHSQVAGNDVGG